VLKAPPNIALQRTYVSAAAPPPLSFGTSGENAMKRQTRPKDFDVVKFKARESTQFN
jgi:hypothetical protein